jgi:hypothetical protein
MFTSLIFKKCNGCGEDKPFSLFAKNKTRKDGYASECKSCASSRIKQARAKDPEKFKERGKKWRETNPNYVDQWKQRNKSRTKTQKRKDYLKSTYGITVLQYENMREAQGHRCYICDKHESEISNAGPTALNVDHCHGTGKLRKLLCMSCNIALGKVNDNVEILQRCINYIKEHSNATNL